VVLAFELAAIVIIGMVVDLAAAKIDRMVTAGVGTSGSASCEISIVVLHPLGSTASSSAIWPSAAIATAGSTVGEASDIGSAMTRLRMTSTSSCGLILVLSNRALKEAEVMFTPDGAERNP